MEKCKASLGYNAVPPPFTGNFMPPKPDIVLPNIDDYATKPIDKSNVVKSCDSKPETVRRESSAPIIKDWESDSDEENEPKSKVVRKAVEPKPVKKENVSKKARPNYAKIEFVRPKSTRQASQDTNSQSRKVRGNQRNWNNMVSQRLGSDYVMVKKACYECRSFNHLIRNCEKKKIVQKPVWNNKNRVNHHNKARMTYPNPKRNIVPKAVLTRSGLVLVNAAKQNLSKVAVSLNTARPINTVVTRPKVNATKEMPNTFKKVHSHVKRPFYNSTAKKNSYYTHRVNTVRGSRVNTARLIVKTARPTKAVNAARSRVAVKTAWPKAVLKAVRGNLGNAVKALAYWVWTPKQKVIDHVSKKNSASMTYKEFNYVDAQGMANGCSMHMTRNKSYLTDFEEIDGGFVAFSGNSSGGKITGKGKIKTGNLDFDDVYFVKELKFNLLSVSQMCDKKNSVLFTDIECFVLSSNFKLADENHVLLKFLRKDNMYSVDLKNIVPKRGLTCLYAKATSNEANLWHRRLGHVNFKTINKLVKGNLVRGLPLKNFEINQTCVACQKGKQHRASCLAKVVSSIYQPLQMLHMDLFGPTFVKSLMKKTYCLVVTDDFRRFTWVFFLATKDETTGILKTFITGIENLIDLKVKIIRSDNVTKPHNKTPYELFLGRKLALGFMRAFGCPVTILNTLDHLGKFNEKIDEGFFIGYSTNSKAFRVFNSRTRIVEENLHVRFNENTPNMVGSGPNCLFDLDALTKTMNYKPVYAWNQTNGSACTKSCQDAGKEGLKKVLEKEYILLPLWAVDPQVSSQPKTFPDGGLKPAEDGEKEDANARVDQEEEEVVNSINILNAANTKEVNVADEDDVGAETDITNLDSNILVSPIPTTRIHKDHPLDQVIRDVHSVTQTRRMSKIMDEHGLVAKIQEGIKHKDFQNCLFACFLSQIEPKKVIQTLTNPSWIEAMQEELLQFKLQKVWTLVDLPNGKREEGIDYDEVFAPVTRIEAIRLFLTYASFMDFTVYQMDIKSAFLYGTIEEEQNSDGIFINQDKYVAEILKKFDFTSVKSASTLMEPNKGLVKDSEAEDVDVHLYRSMISSLMYLTTSRPDIMFAICLWYPKDSPFNLEAYTDSNYARASLDRKSTTGGCQFLGKRLISWQCKKQTIVANSTTEAEYVAAANCCGQVLWIQNQMLDYGFNFMKTKIYIDNESTICIVKNPVFHSKTKHIEIRHHFIRDSYEKRLIKVLKIHTDYNVADLLTKGFDVSGFNFLIASIGEPRVSAVRQNITAVRKNEPINLVVFKAVYEEMYDSVERAATNGTSLEAVQDSSNINRTQSTAIPNDPFLRELVQLIDPGAKKPCGTYMLNLGLRVCLSPMIHHSENLTHFEVMRTVLNSKELMDICTKLSGMCDYLMLISKDLMLSLQVNADKQRLNVVNIVVSEAAIRRLLKFNEEGGMNCLPNTTIFEEIARMGYEKPTQKLTFYKAFFSPQWKFLIHTFLQCLSAKTTVWNEFSSIAASAIICLSTNQQFNFSKFILDGMIRNLDTKAVKFLMYPRFVQLFVNQLEGLPVHHRKYKVPCHTKKIFANMKRKNNDFSGNDTPLFPTMVVQTTTPPPPTKTTTTTTPPPPPTTTTTPTPTPTTTTGEDRLQLNELMNLCTTLQAKVLELEKTKTSQQLKIKSLDRRVKKLEKDKKKRTHKLKRLYKGRRIADIDEDAKVILVYEVQGRKNEGNEEMFDAELDLAGEEVVVEEVIAKEVVVEKVAEKVVEKEVAEKVAEVSLNDDEITLAQTLQKLKSVTPKVKGFSINEPSEFHRADIPMKNNLDKEGFKKFFDEEAMIAKEEAEKEAKLVEDWDNVKAKIDTDYELSSKLQEEEQEEPSIEEKSKLFVELMEKRRKHFAAKRAEEKRSKPPTKAQKRKTMSTYLKNMDGMDSAEEAKKMEGSSKRVGDEIKRKATKKQKMDDEEIAKLQALIEITPDEEEVPMNAIPLATKPPTIVDYGIYKEGRIGFYKITRADGLDTIFRVFSVLLHSFDKEDLETLWKLVKARHGDTTPNEGYKRVL
ncbi:putative ribonuclease H-like domain-containing protein [Tanacetum coccineum]